MKKQLGISVVVATLYLVSYVCWANSIGPLYDFEYSLLVCQNRAVNIIASQCIYFLSIFGLAGALAFVAIKRFKLKNRFKAIAFLLMTLLIIPIIIMVIQFLFWLRLDHINDKVRYINLLDRLSLGIYIIFVFVGLKTLFKTSFINTLSILIYGLVLFSILAAVVYSILKDSFLNDFKVIEEHYYSEALFQKNKKIYEEATKKYPEREKCHYFLGETYRNYIDFALTKKQRGVYLDSAEKAYLKALSINPHFLKAKIGLGSTYIKKKQNQKALIIFQAVALKTPDDKHVNVKLGEIFLNLNNLDKAKEYFKKGYGDLNSKERESQYYIRTTSNLKLQGNETVNLATDMSWKIVEPYFYKYNFDSLETAEKSIINLYNVSLSPVLGQYSTRDISLSTYEIERAMHLKLNSVITISSGVEVTKLKITIQE